MKISIIYFSHTGKTETMAQIVAEGARKALPEAEVVAYSIDEVDLDFVNASAAVIFGTPDYYASESWQLKKWLDTCPCKLAGKLGAAFCTANFKQGGADVAIQSVLTQLLVKGLLIYSGGVSFGLPFIHLGPIATKDEFEEDKALFKVFGERIALKTAELFAKAT